MEKQTDIRALPSYGSPGDVCFNLRPAVPAAGGTGLVPVGAPVKYTALGGFRPLCRCGDCLLVSKGGKVMYFADKNGLDRPGVTVDVGSEVRCALGDGNAALVMTAAGPVEVDGPSPSTSFHKADSEYPAVRLYASPTVQFSEVVRSRSLSKSYSGSGRLVEADSAALVGDLREAYRALCVKAAASGVFIQPVLARYRLRARDGRSLFVSPPVLLSHPEGAQCDVPVALQSADGAMVNSYTLSAKGWFLCADIPEGLPDVDVEIWLSPMFHPYNPDMPSSAATTRGDSSVFATVSLPGAYCGISRHYALAGARTLADAFARMDMLERLAAVVPPVPGTVFPECMPGPDADSAARTLRSVLEKPVPAPDHVLNSIARPHSFSAECVAVSPGVCLWGNITSIPYNGYPFSVFSADAEVSSSTITVTVSFGEGKGVRRTDTFTSLSPSKIGPLISYPSPEAREITVISSAGGVLRKGTYPLTPDPSGKAAIYIAPDFLPFELPQASAASLVDLRSASVEMPGYVAVAYPDRPLDIISMRDIGAPVRAAVSIPGRDLSWEFGRSRFLLSAGGGLYSFVVGSRMATGSRLIAADPGVPALAVGIGCAFVLLGGSPYIADCSGRLRRISADTGYKFLAFNEEKGELWCFSEGGRADVFVRDCDWRYFSTAVSGVTAAVTVAGRPYAQADGFLASLAEETDAPVDISYRVLTLTAPDKPARLRRVVFRLRANGVQLYLGAEDAGLDGTAKRTLFTRRVVGDFRSPMCVPVFGPPAEAFAVRLQGSVNPSSFRFSGVNIGMEYGKGKN